MGKSLEDVPGITAGFQYPVQMRFNELMTGARQDVVCKIFEKIWIPSPDMQTGLVRLLRVYKEQKTSL